MEKDTQINNQIRKGEIFEKNRITESEYNKINITDEYNIVKTEQKEAKKEFQDYKKNIDQVVAHLLGRKNYNASPENIKKIFCELIDFVLHDFHTFNQTDLDLALNKDFIKEYLNKNDVKEYISSFTNEETNEHSNFEHIAETYSKTKLSCDVKYNDLDHRKTQNKEELNELEKFIYEEYVINHVTFEGRNVEVIKNSKTSADSHTIPNILIQEIMNKHQGNANFNYRIAIQEVENIIKKQIYNLSDNKSENLSTISSTELSNFIINKVNEYLKDDGYSKEFIKPITVENKELYSINKRLLDKYIEIYARDIFPNNVRELYKLKENETEDKSNLKLKEAYELLDERLQELRSQGDQTPAAPYQAEKEKPLSRPRR